MGADRNESVRAWRTSCSRKADSCTGDAGSRQGCRQLAGEATLPSVTPHGSTEMKSRLSMSEANTAAWFFLAPALSLIGIFFFLPVAASLLLSVTYFDLYGIADPGNTRFVGFDNYSRLLQSHDFWVALKNTFYFAFVGGPLTIAVSLGAALLLSSKLVRFKGFFRTIYFTPFVT